MIGPVGRYVIYNIERLRKMRGLSFRDLAVRLAELGRPIGDTVLHRQSQGKRRIDADDLIAFAIALGVNPNALLFPHDADRGDLVELTAERSQRARVVWSWADGEMPLPAEDPGPFLPTAEFPDTVTADFRENARPTLALRGRNAMVNEVEILLGRADQAAYARTSSGMMTPGNRKWWRDRVERQLERVRLAIEEEFASPLPELPEDDGQIIVIDGDDEGDAGGRLRPLAPGPPSGGCEEVQRAPQGTERRARHRPALAGARQGRRREAVQTELRVRDRRQGQGRGVEDRRPRGDVRRRAGRGDHAAPVRRAVAQDPRS
jgi:transcriptional regulator with XRE-family HTH domain